MPLQPYLKRIIEDREILSRVDAAELLRSILRGESTDLEIAALLGSLATRGAASTEIAGFVDTMREAATPVPLTQAERTLLVDTCGTGADLSGATLAGVKWRITRCPDGTNSRQDGGTCANNLG